MAMQQVSPAKMIYPNMLITRMEMCMMSFSASLGSPKSVTWIMNTTFGSHQELNIPSTQQPIIS
jgi:hypothetical protein